MKRHAPATARNSLPLADVLARELPERGLVLELASGSGEHAVFLAQHFPELDWQPSDVDTAALASTAAWAEDAELANLRPPIALDAASPDWPIDRADAVLCVNMVHISAWDATVGLFRGSSQCLTDGASILLYGPYLEDDVETALSNLAFDRSLKERDAAWGLRNLGDMDRLAAEFGFFRSRRYEMPANNLTLVYRKRSAIGC